MSERDPGRPHTETLQLDVSIVPDAATISTTRNAVETLSTRLLTDADVGWRIGMAAHELLENARKYGRDDTARLRVDLNATDPDCIAHVEVRSRGTGANIETAQGLIADLEKTADAWAYYLGAIQRAGESVEGSGIGLARIWAEGEMSLELSFDTDGLLCVHARLAPGEVE